MSPNCRPSVAGAFGSAGLHNRDSARPSPPMDIHAIVQVVEFVHNNEAWAVPVVFALAFGESLAFISLLIPAWGALVAIGALIGQAGSASGRSGFRHRLGRPSATGCPIGLASNSNTPSRICGHYHGTPILFRAAKPS